MNYEYIAKQTPIKKGVEKLQAELTQAWKDIESLPVIELAARNPSVMEYTKHWEGRAVAAEQRISELEAQNERLWVALKAYHSNSAKQDWPDDIWIAAEVALREAAIAAAESNASTHELNSANSLGVGK